MATKKIKLEDVVLDAVDPSGKWIMIIKKPACEHAPDMLGIYWSVPWPHDEFAKRQALLKSAKEENPWGGQECDFLLARKVVVDGFDVRVFPHEFSVMNAEKMGIYVHGCDGDPGSHELVAGNVSESIMITEALNTDQAFLRDAAMLDGCNEQQALTVALGGDISDEQFDFPAIGWYRLRDAYREYFGV